MRFLTPKRIKTVLFSLICCFAVILFSCNPSNKLTKEGDRVYANKQYEDATSFYYNALLKNPKNKRAQAGLQQSAQLVLNQKFSDFRKLVLDNKIEEAIKQYQYSEAFA